MSTSRTLKSLATCIILSLPATADAQTEYINAIEFSTQPVINEPTTITLKYVADSCAAESATLDQGNFRHSITLRFNPEIFCATVVTQHQITLAAASFGAGSHLVDVFYDRSQPPALPKFYVKQTYDFSVQGKASPILFVDPASNLTDPTDRIPYSDFDVGGQWYEPASSGSGLFLNHKKFQKTDSIVGSWLNYTDDGKTSWFYLSGLNWTSSREHVGVVYQTKADPIACTFLPGDNPCFNPLKPVRASSINAIGSYRITFSSRETAEMQLRLFRGFNTRLIQLQKQ